MHKNCRGCFAVLSARVRQGRGTAKKIDGHVHRWESPVSQKSLGLFPFCQSFYIIYITDHHHKVAMDDSKKHHTSPSGSRSPGKRNVETDAPTRRLMARGCPDDEPVTGIRTVPRSRDHGSLNLQSASRKRKSLAPPEPSVVVIPSPTSQIVHRIDSIRLQSPMVSHALSTIAPTTANLDASTRRETLVMPMSSLPLVRDRSSAHLSATPIYVPKSSGRFQPEESDIEMESSPSVPQSGMTHTHTHTCT